MIYKNIEFHNVAEIVENDNGSISFRRVPKSVQDAMEMNKEICECATGVELRFVMKSDTVKIKLKKKDGKLSTVNVFRGAILASWDELEKVVTPDGTEIVIKKHPHPETLMKMSEELKTSWSPEVIRVMFNHGYYEFVDIVGEVEPPLKSQVPQKKLMVYGSSITHGSNSVIAYMSWVSILSKKLNVDNINLGMAGSCAMEPEMVNYIASEGENGKWDFAILELGINVLNWDKKKIADRVKNTLEQNAGRNQYKKVFVVSPFYCNDDFYGTGQANLWRAYIKDIADELNYSNVTVIDGLDMLGKMCYLSADEIHPSIDGMIMIADNMYKYICENYEQISLNNRRGKENA